MGTIVASAILSDARIILNDNAAVRWANSELFNWLEDGQREVAVIRPDVCAITSSVQLAAGTKQTIPSGGTRIFKVVRNMGTTPGTTPGAVVRPIDMVLCGTCGNLYAPSHLAGRYEGQGCPICLDRKAS